MTISSVARSEIVSVSFPKEAVPAGGSLSNAGATEAEALDAATGAGGALSGVGAGTAAVAATAAGMGITWKGRTNGQATRSELAHLDKLEGKTTTPTGAPVSITQSETAKKAMSSNENKSADAARQKMVNSGESELTQIAGYGFRNSGTNNAGIKATATSATALGMSQQLNADLSAVKAAEQESGARQARDVEAERLAKANNDAKTRRVIQTNLDSQSEVVNIMRENLAETKRMHQTLMSINKGIQTLVTNSATSLRGDSKATPNAPRKPTPPENVPVTMRV